MTGLVEIIRRLQGDESQVKFAARLGIDQPELSKILRGERRPARRTIVGLLRAFPKHRNEIVAALTADNSAGVAHGAPNEPSTAGDATVIEAPNGRARTAVGTSVPAR